MACGVARGAGVEAQARAQLEAPLQAVVGDRPAPRQEAVRLPVGALHQQRLVDRARSAGRCARPSGRGARTGSRRPRGGSSPLLLQEGDDGRDGLLGPLDEVAVAAALEHASAARPGCPPPCARAPAPSGPASTGVRQSSPPAMTSVGAVMRWSSGTTSVSIMASQASQNTGVVTLRAVTSRISCTRSSPTRVEVRAREGLGRQLQRHCLAVDAVGLREQLPDLELGASHAVAAGDGAADHQPVDALGVAGREARGDEAAHGAAVHVQALDAERRPAAPPGRRPRRRGRSAGRAGRSRRSRGGRSRAP